MVKRRQVLPPHPSPYPRDRWKNVASAGTELRLSNGVSLIGKFDGEFATHSSTYAGTGTVRYAW